MSSLYLAVTISDKQTRDTLGLYQTQLKQQLEGDWVDSTTFHITVEHLGNDEVDSKKVINGLKLFEERYKPKSFYAFATKVNRFEQNVLWIGVNNSFKLYEMRYQILDMLKETGYQKMESKFEGYTPHITMGFKVEDKSFVCDIKKVPILIDNITLWNSFKCNGAYVENKLYVAKFV